MSTIKQQPLTVTALKHNKTIIAILKGMRQAQQQGRPVYLENRNGDRYMRIQWVPTLTTTKRHGCRKIISTHRPASFQFFTRLERDVTSVVHEAVEWFWPKGAQVLFDKVIAEAKQADALQIKEELERDKAKPRVQSKAARRAMHRAAAEAYAKGRGLSISSVAVVKYEGRTWYTAQLKQTFWERWSKQPGMVVITGDEVNRYQHPVSASPGFIQGCHTKAKGYRPHVPYGQVSRAFINWTPTSLV